MKKEANCGCRLPLGSRCKKHHKEYVLKVKANDLPGEKEGPKGTMCSFGPCGNGQRMDSGKPLHKIPIALRQDVFKRNKSAT